MITSLTVKWICSKSNSRTKRCNLLKIETTFMSKYFSMKMRRNVSFLKISISWTLTTFELSALFSNLSVPFKIESFQLDDFVYYFTIKFLWLSMLFIVLNSSKTDILAWGSFCGSDWLILIGRRTETNFGKFSNYSQTFHGCCSDIFLMLTLQYYVRYLPNFQYYLIYLSSSSCQEHSRIES